MPTLRTDDGPRKLRAVWLGPKGATLPFEWTYVQWAVVLLGIVIMPLILGPLTLAVTGDTAWAIVIGLVWGGPLGAWLATKMMRRVSFDEPLRYKFQLAKDIRRNHYGSAAARHERVAMPPIAHLSHPTVRSLRWDDPAQHPTQKDLIQ